MISENQSRKEIQREKSEEVLQEKRKNTDKNIRIVLGIISVIIFVIAVVLGILSFRMTGVVPNRIMFESINFSGTVKGILFVVLLLGVLIKLGIAILLIGVIWGIYFLVKFIKRKIEEDK